MHPMTALFFFVATITSWVAPAFTTAYNSLLIHLPVHYFSTLYDNLIF